MGYWVGQGFVLDGDLIGGGIALVQLARNGVLIIFQSQFAQDFFQSGFCPDGDSVDRGSLSPVVQKWGFNNFSSPSLLRTFSSPSLLRTFFSPNLLRTHFFQSQFDQDSVLDGDLIDGGTALVQLAKNGVLIIFPIPVSSGFSSPSFLRIPFSSPSLLRTLP